LIRQALATLLVGLALAAMVAGLVAGALDLTGDLPHFNFDQGVLHGLSNVNYSTVIIALAAGIAAMLAFETRASAAVGVAISVTTIPASAYLGVAFALGHGSKGLNALAVLAVNVVALLFSGSVTLAVQQLAARQRAR
jgi:Domain of unknown function (DUF389)